MGKWDWKKVVYNVVMVCYVRVFDVIVEVKG